MQETHSHNPTDIARRLANVRGRGHLRDMIYGGIDGAVTTFAIVAGVEGAGLAPRVIIALGIANVLADGFSMAAGNYSGTKAELDEVRRLRAIEDDHITRYPEGEREELRQILELKGLSGDVLEKATDAITADRKRWIDIMLTDEYGMPSTDPRPMAAAVATFLAFLAAGLVPLLPFLTGMARPFETAIVITGIVFFTIGAAKSRWSLTPWWRSGLETLAIGSAAAAIAFCVGLLFHA